MEALMISESPAEGFTQETILNDVIGILADMTSDWEMEFTEPIGISTKIIADLNFESIDVVQLVVALEERYQRRGLPFEEVLMADGRYVDEFQVGDIVAFLYRNLNKDGKKSL
jgi:acyl carrier protein